MTFPQYIAAFAQGFWAHIVGKDVGHEAPQSKAWLQGRALAFHISGGW